MTCTKCWNIYMFGIFLGHTFVYYIVVFLKKLIIIYDIKVYGPSNEKLLWSKFYYTSWVTVVSDKKKVVVGKKIVCEKNVANDKILVVDLPFLFRNII